MDRLSVSGLAETATLEDLRQLFVREGLSIINIRVGCDREAFIDCPDQNTADRAIEAFNGLLFMGSVLRVEPDLHKKKVSFVEPPVQKMKIIKKKLILNSNRSSKIQVRQIPCEVSWSEFEDLARTFGEVLTFEHHDTSGSNPVASITYATPEEAQKALNELNNRQHEGSVLKASYVSANENRQPRPPRKPYRNSVGGPSANAHHSYASTPNAADMPLRISVPSELVGAIIGVGGANIRAITKESKARCVVDVNRGLRDQSGNPEKTINIYGLPENCSKACLKILEVVQRELSKDQPQGAQQKDLEPELKIRAHNNLVGRLIGKGGSTIKKIMDETGCNIFVSSISELNSYNMERTIIIRSSSLQSISKAEERISAKLRLCWESDMANAQPGFYGINPLMLPNPAESAYYGAPVGMNPSIYGGGGQAGVPPQQLLSINPHATIHHGGPLFPASAYHQQEIQQPHPLAQEVVHVWVPNSIVGALIGTKGVHIRNVMRLTGAHIRIEQQTGSSGMHPSEQLALGGHPQGQDSERLVTITGTDAQQYKAQYWIYQRVCEQSHHFIDEVRLCIEINVPYKLVGRIIGKNGSNVSLRGFFWRLVRDLQRTTGAQIKIPEDSSTDSTETAVRIIGNFNAVQSVQARIRQLATHFYQTQLGGM